MSTCTQNLTFSLRFWHAFCKGVMFHVERWRAVKCFTWNITGVLHDFSF